MVPVPGGRAYIPWGCGNTYLVYTWYIPLSLVWEHTAISTEVCLELLFTAQTHSGTGKTGKKSKGMPKSQLLPKPTTIENAVLPPHIATGPGKQYRPWMTPAYTVLNYKYIFIYSFIYSYMYIYI